MKASPWCVYTVNGINVHVRIGHENNNMQDPDKRKSYTVVDETSQELVSITPKVYTKGGTWIVPGVTCTIAAGVLNGLYKCGVLAEVCLIVYSCKSRPKHFAMNHITNYAKVPNIFKHDVVIVSGGVYLTDYATKAPFPCTGCNETAWHWLENNVHDLAQPIIFWNIGG